MNPAKALLLTIIVFAGLLVYLLAPVLTPFLIAATLAYVSDPLVDRLERWRLSRGQAVVVVFAFLTLVLVGVLLLLVPLLAEQVALLAKRFPDYLDRFQDEFWPWLERTLGFDLPELDLASFKTLVADHWQEAGGVASGLLRGLSESGFTLLGWLANLVLIPVITFYLLRDWDRLIARLGELVPRRLAPVVGRLARESDEVLGGFLRGQLLVMVALGMIYSAGLAIVGVEFALLIGMLAGLFSFVPYLGFAVGLGAAGIAVVMQFHDLQSLLYVLVVFSAGQVLESFVLTPWLLGDRIGLHPVAVIFAVLAGGQLFGFVGMLLALPTAAVAVVLLRFAHEHYLASELYGVDR